MESPIPQRGPYKGLSPYASEDADFFFGRETETRLIIANLFASPLTLLYGVSGVGKSSVLNAGVAHQLYGKDNVCPIVFSDWAKNPLEDLKTAVANALAKRVSPKDKLPSLKTPLPEFLRQYAQCSESRLAIMLDQFEDYLQYHPLYTPFASEFSLSFLKTKAPFSFLISIREDALARLDRFEGSIPILFDNYLRLEPLDRQAGRVAIESPLKEFSKFFLTEGPPYSAEEELCEAVLEQVKIEELGLGLARDSLQKEPRKHQIDTVYLQLVMQRLWAEEFRQKSRVLRRRTLDALQAKRPIVMTYLNEVMDTLTTEEKEIASRVFVYLVTPSGSRVAYPVNELAVSEKIDKEKLTNVLQRLSVGENRILRQVVTSPDPSVAPRYEIFHPALALAILEWRASFVSEQREVEIRLAGLKLQQEIAAKLERKSKQVTRLLIALIGLGLLIISLAITGFYIFRLQRMAQAAQRKAEEQTAEVTRLKGEADEYIKLVKAQELATRDTRAVMRRHEAPVTCAAFSQDHSLIITGSQDGTAIVWDTNGTLIQRLVGHSGAIQDVAFSPDGNYVATAGDDHTVRLWNRHTWEPIVMWEHEAPVLSVAFAHTHNLLVSSSRDGTSRIWAQGNTQSSFVLKGHTGPVRYCEFSPDDTLIVTASADTTARVWSSESGELKYILNEHKGEVSRASFGVQGRRIVTASKDHTARVWDTASGRRLHVLSGHTDAVNDAEFSPDGKYIVTASADLSARIWNDNGILYSSLKEHRGSVNTARFSADGERVVTASDDKTARTWNARSQSGPIALVELKGHLDKVTNAIFVAGDEIVLTISDDQTARLWDVARFGGFRVEEVSIGQITYQGPCPTLIPVQAKVTFEGSGVLRFTWSPGPAGQSRKGAILATTSPTYISYNFRLDGPPESTISGVMGLQINEPTSASAKQPFKLRCTAAQSPPPTPSPSPSPKQ